MYKHRFSSRIVTLSGELFNQLSYGVKHNSHGKELKKHQAYQGNDSFGKKSKNNLSFNQKHAFTQTLGSAFLDRIRKIQNSKHEFDLFKIFDCLIDGYGSVNSERVIFLLILDYFFIKTLSELFLFQFNCFSTNKFMLIFYKMQKK